MADINFIRDLDAYSGGFISAEALLGDILPTGTRHLLREGLEEHIKQHLGGRHLAGMTYDGTKRELVVKTSEQKQIMARYARGDKDYDAVVKFVNWNTPHFSIGDVVSVIPGYEHRLKYNFRGEVTDICALFKEFTVLNCDGSTVLLDAHGRKVAASSHHLQLVRSVAKLSDKYPQEYEDIDGIIVKDSQPRSNIIMEVNK